MAFWQKILDFFSDLSRSYKTFLVVLVVASLTALICQNPFRKTFPLYSIGDIARKDVKAPENMRVVDEELTEKRRSTAAEQVLEVYDFDPQAKQVFLGRLAKSFELLSGQNIKSDKFRSSFEEALGSNVSAAQWNILKEPTYHGLIKRIAQKIVKEYSTQWILEESSVPSRFEILLRDVRTGDEFKVSQKAYQKKIVPLSDVRDWIRNPARWNARDFGEMPDQLRREVLLLLANLIEPDLVLNLIETKSRREDAKNKVESVWAETFKGEMIIREGQRVDRRHYLLFQGLKSLEKSQPNTRATFLFGFFIFCMIFIFYFIGQSNFKKFRFNFRDQWVIGSFFVVSLALIAGLEHLFNSARDQTVIGPSLPYLLPVAFAGMTVRLFSSMEITTFFIVLFSISIGWFMENPFFGMTAMAASLVGAGRMRHINQRFDVFKAGLVSGLVKALMAVIGLALSLTPNPDLGNIFADFLIVASFSVAAGLISASLILGLQPLLEYVGYTTDLRLMELSSTNHPLLKDLILKAPGTYFHSFTVSQLAEKAAEAINANALFARVASLYHDIGKVTKPQYFIENIKGENKHDKLAPTMSALIISNHVKEGIELGYENKLPQSIIDVIPQHHGTALISYFYDKAQKHAEEDEVIEERDFRYPGPKPQTRESAIILLADAVEATAKSLQSKSPDLLGQVVHSTIQRFFLDGQLDECELTLKDLNAIGNAFLQVLQGVYHQRIDYPHLKEDQQEADERAISNITKFKPS